MMEFVKSCCFLAYICRLCPSRHTLCKTRQLTQSGHRREVQSKSVARYL